MQKPLKYDREALGERRAHPPPRRGPSRGPRLVSRIVTLALFLATGLLVSGCKSASVSEVRGKTSFGPEFRHQGQKNTDEIRYDARQAVELRWDNGWTTGMTYRRRDIDGGSGDNENLFLFEVGYPIWKAPKKPDKTAMQIEELQKQIGELQSQFAKTNSQDAGSPRFAKVEETDSGHRLDKENGYAQP